MLVASLDDNRVEASRDLARSTNYVCPECNVPVILHKGLIVTPHFAHQPHSKCQFGIGEGQDHMAVKANLAAALRNKGIQVEIEHKLYDSSNRYMIADLFARRRSICAIEIVDEHDDLEHIEEKQSFYRKIGVGCWWLPIVRKDWRTYFERLDEDSGPYRTRAFEKWLLDHEKRVCFIVPPDQFVMCTAEPYWVEKEECYVGDTFYSGYCYASRVSVWLSKGKCGTFNEL